MERHTERIDGVATRLHRLSDEELSNAVIYAIGRIEAAGHDLMVLQTEQGRRSGQEQLPLGELAVIHTFQTSLGAEPPPTAA